MKAYRTVIASTVRPQQFNLDAIVEPHSHWWACSCRRGVSQYAYGLLSVIDAAIDFGDKAMQYSQRQQVKLKWWQDVEAVKLRSLAWTFWCCCVTCASTPQDNLQYKRWDTCLDGTEKMFMVNWADPDPGLTPENYDLALVTSEFMLLVCWPLWHQDRKASVYALYFRIWNRLENGASNRDFSFVALRTYGTSDGHGQSKAFNKLGIAKVFEWKEPEGYIAHRKGPKLDVMNKGFKYDLGPANVCPIS
ncbi:hypothetical protein CCHR01_09691 [Colletotrichum chrysophilum]|uniref:Uncharacterized protein n=1 Tax=Colletotrichum chrysophilum TaxID=1836956 RepID=A0AAD9EDX6_9PEZI|nr:hypothetical protein CCHR01_09691 [Colletotrichum chrysophilum]